MRRANISDKPVIIDILKLAFDNNKSVNYVVKQDRHRVRRIEWLMDYSFSMCSRFGDVWISDDQQACALVLFPDKRKSSLGTLVLDLKLALSVIGLTRVGAVLKRDSMIKANHPKVPIAYVWFVGVHPKGQGTGIGTAFTKEVIQECEKMNRPIYLETSVDRNLPFYKKLGFEIFNTIQLSYTLYLMRRVQ